MKDHLRFFCLFFCLLCSSLSHAQSDTLCCSAQSSVQGQGLLEQSLRKIFSLLQADSLQAARDSLNSALRLYPDASQSVFLYRYLAQLDEREGKMSQALEHYTMGIHRYPRATGLLLDRAALYYRLGNRARSVSDYSAVLDLDPDNQEALFMRAHLRYEERNYSGARSDYEVLLRLCPDHLRAHCGLVLVNDHSGRSVEAMTTMDALIQMHPHESMLYALRGGMYQRRRQYELALIDLSQAIALMPQNPDYYVSRATLYLEMGHRKQARQDVRQATKLGADAREMAGLMKR